MKAKGSVVTRPSRKLCRCSQSRMSSRRRNANATANPKNATSGINDEIEVKMRPSVQYCGATASGCVSV